MSEEGRIAVLNAHPRIGADPASLSALSRREQRGGADLATLREWARRRGWDRIRLLSSHDNTSNKDFLMEEDAGRQRPGVSVFNRASDGKIYHFYTTEASFAPGHHRSIDLYSPVWNLFDLLPEGRENWMPKHSY